MTPPPLTTFPATRESSPTRGDDLATPDTAPQAGPERVRVDGPGRVTGGAVDREDYSEGEAPASALRRLASLTVRSGPVSLLLSVVSVVSWVVACGSMTARDYTDLGLISATTPAFWLALVAAVAALVVALRAPRFHQWLALLSVLALILVLYATPAMVEGTPRVEATYRHLGISEHLALTGELERTLDAYFNWPGFFALLAQIQGAAHAPDLLVVGRFAPAVAAIAYLPPVLLIARSLVPSPRVRWLAAAIFVMANWTGQDYLAPQTFAFWLLLCVAGVVMTVLRRHDDPDREGVSGAVLARVRPRLPRKLSWLSGTDEGNRSWVADDGVRRRLTRAQWVAVHGVLTLGIIAVSASHQLTPFMLALLLFALWVVGRSPHWWLWVLSGLVIVFWLAVPAAPFVRGHLAGLIEGVGGLFTGASDGPGLGSRTASGSVEHQLVVTARMGETLAVWAVAGLGTIVLLLARRRIRAFVILAGAPFLLIPMQAYGGEMLIRAYLFSLPLVALLMAVFLTWLGRTGRLGAATAALVILALAGTTVLTRYGNERGESFTRSEVSALSWFYAHSPSGSTVVTMTQNLPRPIQRYAENQWTFLNDGSPGPRWTVPVDPSRLAAQGLIAKYYSGREAGGPVYVIYTRSMETLAELSGNISPGGMQPAIAAMDQDPRFVRIYRSDDASIWRLRDGVRLVDAGTQAQVAGAIGSASTLAGSAR